MKKLLLTLTLILPTLAWANPPIVTGDCHGATYPEINSPEYRIECVNAQPFNPNDPTTFRKSDWYVVTSPDPHAQNQGNLIKGTIAQVNGAYVIDEEFQVINRGDNNAVRGIKAWAYDPDQHEGVDGSAGMFYTQSTESSNPANPNEYYGVVATLAPNKDHPTNGTSAFPTRTTNPKFYWKNALDVADGTAEFGANLNHSKLKFARFYDVEDDKGLHRYLCDKTGNNCKLYHTDWFVE